MPVWLTYFFGAIVAVGITLALLSEIRETRENRRGWRLGRDTWGVRYEEKTKEGVWDSLLIRATLRGHSFGEAHVPLDAVWDPRFPAWAHGRREEIVSRIRSERPKLPFVDEDPNQPPRAASPTRSYRDT
ncbi:MAG: hypothetical protein WDM96_15875 [Lacunisphaera sp.]